MLAYKPMNISAKKMMELREILSRSAVENSKAEYAPVDLAEKAGTCARLAVDFLADANQHLISGNLDRMASCLRIASEYASEAARIKNGFTYKSEK